MSRLLPGAGGTACMSRNINSSRKPRSSHSAGLMPFSPTSRRLPLAAMAGYLTTQAIDGLALAETTPGPLIMVLQFIGFMAGWNNPQGLTPAMSGVIGALVTTYTTFLPCFLFIFLGAPYIEVLRGNKSLTGALTGITASVVGVILNLALVFGAAVIWPQGLQGGTNWFAALMSRSGIRGSLPIQSRRAVGCSHRRVDRIMSHFISST